VKRTALFVLGGAALVAWLAGPENTFVSGQAVIADGGFTRV
jgi:3-oxoacyl-[acyl-carrier protein] reductase